MVYFFISFTLAISSMVLINTGLKFSSNVIGCFSTVLCTLDSLLDLDIGSNVMLISAQYTALKGLTTIP